MKSRMRQADFSPWHSDSLLIMSNPIIIIRRGESFIERKKSGRAACSVFSRPCDVIKCTLMGRHCGSVQYGEQVRTDDHPQMTAHSGMHFSTEMVSR